MLGIPFLGGRRHAVYTDQGNRVLIAPRFGTVAFGV